MVVDDRVRRDSKAVVNRGQKLPGMDRIVDGGRGGLVALAMHDAAANARSRDDGCITIGPMIAPIGAVAVA